MTLRLINVLSEVIDTLVAVLVSMKVHRIWLKQSFSVAVQLTASLCSLMVIFTQVNVSEKIVFVDISFSINGCAEMHRFLPTVSNIPFNAFFFMTKSVNNVLIG